jgi:hypothetical protein
VLRFYWKLLLRGPVLLWEASKGWVTFTGIAAFYLALSPRLAKVGLSLFGSISPLWALLPVGLLFLYGLLKANYEQFQVVEEDRNHLQREKTTSAKRVALKEALGEAEEE